MAGFYEPTLRTAGRQKKVMASKTENCLCSYESGPASAGLTDLIKMNSKSVSCAPSTSLKGNLNFCTSCPNLATNGTMDTFAATFLIDFWQMTVGF